MIKQNFNKITLLKKPVICAPGFCLIVLVLFVSCKNSTVKNGNPSERDSICFNLSVTTICDSVKVMNNIMDRLNFAEKQPRIKSWFVENYESDKIDINGYIYSIKGLNPKDFNVFKELDISDRVRFYCLIRFFLSNNLTACSEWAIGTTSSSAYFYNYRNYENINEENYNRYIILQDKKINYESESVLNTFKVLDQRNGLVLLKENYHNYLKEHSK